MKTGKHKRGPATRPGRRKDRPVLPAMPIGEAMRRIRNERRIRTQADG